MQINDLDRPDIPRLERSQLWFGPSAAAERPESFDPGIDASVILTREAGGLQRESRRGAAIRRESVRLVTEQGIEVRAGEGTEFTGSVLGIRIEEPHPGTLFLRFIYEPRGPGVLTAESERRALRPVYYFADIETVRRIRLLVPLVL